MEEFITPATSTPVLEIIRLILNFLLASGLVGTLLFFKTKKRKESVETLEKKLDKLSIIIENKDVEISENRHIIRQAFKCEYVDTPEDCPVLTLKAEYDRKKKLQLDKEAEEARIRAKEAHQ